jgi:hypothetical protein
LGAGDSGGIPVGSMAGGAIIAIDGVTGDVAVDTDIELLKHTVTKEMTI